MVSREVIDVHHPKDFLKQQPELFDPTQISYTDNLRKKQTWEDIDPQTTLEWRNVAEEENKAQSKYIMRFKLTLLIKTQEYMSLHISG